jgi:hydroxymethylpyrimidine/phosphomethylpyrimidine kinase
MSGPPPAPAALCSAPVAPASRIPVCLAIAGSDSGGGAGIQADLKAFAAAGVHGTTAITAITAQSTIGVTAVEPVSPRMIVAQVEAVADDLGVDAVKIGMVGGVPAIEAVAQALELLPAGTPVVLDPVMVAESGARLLEEDAQSALVELLVPRATVATPNVPEARVLAGDEEAALDSEALVRAVHRLGPEAAVVTGGHRSDATDLFFDGREVIAIPGERYADGAAHGSGCTHSSTLAAALALGRDPLQAAREARAAAGAAVRDGLRGLGKGAGPVNVLGVRAERRGR